MQEEVVPTTKEEELLLDAIARALILIAKETIQNDEKTEGTVE